MEATEGDDGEGLEGGLVAALEGPGNKKAIKCPLRPLS